MKLLHDRIGVSSSIRQTLLSAGLGLTNALPPKFSLAEPTNKKLRLAFIGVGGRGGANLKTMTKDPDVEVVALCDVQSPQSRYGS